MSVATSPFSFHMKKFLLISVLTLLASLNAKAQIPVEVVFGDKQASFDLMFFKYLKDKNDENTNLLFFNRNIASFDYRMTDSTYLPSFAFTEAISYNDSKLKGFAPVLVTQFTNRGIYPKAGVQFAHVRERFTIFTWLVSETLENPEIDYYLLLRFTPKLTEKLNLYSQTESLNVFSTENGIGNRYYQRIRLGLDIHYWQFGFAANLTTITSASNTQFSSNIGGFLRHEF